MIGLKIAGMSAAQLADPNYTKITSNDSGLASHPEAEAPTPGSNDWALLGGGFNVEYGGAGNMATSSFPTTNHTWKARAKDHIAGNPANLRVYGIYLKRQLPVGYVLSDQRPGAANSSQHPQATANVKDGFALTGGGAEVHWQGWGNMLYKLEPHVDGSQGFRAAAKDHIKPSTATLTAWAVGIRF